MKKDTLTSINNLLNTEDENLKKLHKIVADSIHEKKLISQRLKKEFNEEPKFSDFIADKIATFGGSWTFIFLFVFIIILWIIINVHFLQNNAFDPYPFILLNLFLSCVAALQAPVILMSQNRLEIKDRKRAEHDYMVNLKAEVEIRALHQKIDVLILEQMKNLLEIQEQQLKKLDDLKK